ncbi:MAG: hypothetical protein KF878_29165 [Planctomycetes bacterium]|nr:hypothetical protein [Planctomycetota bacterium]
MRDRSPVETVLTYATFMALSLALHIVVILGNRPLIERGDGPAARGVAAAAEEVERVK